MKSRQPKLFEPEVTIPEELSESVALWRAYKKRQFRFIYTTEALAALVERMAEMGPERAMAAVKWSMGGSGHPYKGLFEPPAKGGGGAPHRDAPPERYQPYMSDKTIDDWPHLDKNSRQCIIENITLGHRVRYR